MRIEILLHQTIKVFNSYVTSGAVSDSYSKPLDRLTSPGSTLASPLFHSVVYTATQRMESGRAAEETITESDLEAVIKVYSHTIPHGNVHVHA